MMRVVLLVAVLLAGCSGPSTDATDADEPQGPTPTLAERTVVVTDVDVPVSADPEFLVDAVFPNGTRQAIVEFWPDGAYSSLEIHVGACTAYSVAGGTHAGSGGRLDGRCAAMGGTLPVSLQATGLVGGHLQVTASVLS